MHHLKAQIDQLQQEINQSQQDIDQDVKNLQETQDKVRELNAKKATLKHLLDDIQAAQLASQKGRDAAQKEADAAQALYDDQYPKLNGKLNDQQRQAIQAAVKAVDDEIQALKAEVDNLSGPNDQAKQAAAQAEEQAKAKEQAYQAAQDRLRQLPADIQTAQANAARLRAAVKADADNQKVSEAFYLAGELKGAIDQLKALLKPEKEVGLVNDLITSSTELRSAQDDAASKKADSDQEQTALTAKEQEWQKKVRGRQEAIKAVINAIPAPQGQPQQPQPVQA
jgi:colicin import membrane protein